MSSLADEFAGVPIDGASLADLGIDEVEPACCEDTYENRRILRKVKWWWDPVREGDGSPTRLLRVFNPEDMKVRRLSVWDRKKPILVDELNPWSDYIPVLEMPANADIPNWIRGAIRNWITDDANGVPESKRKALPTRCDMVREDGTRCWNWSSRDDGIARCNSHMHNPATSEARSIAAARMKLVQASPAAVDTLEYLMDHGEAEAVRLNASKEILDRAGVRGGYEVTSEIDVTVTDSATVVKGRLERLAASIAMAKELEEKRLALEELETVDAEVVEETEAGPPAESPVVEVDSVKVVRDDG
jgi:hypothetical protein